MVTKYHLVTNSNIYIYIYVNKKICVNCNFSVSY